VVNLSEVGQFIKRELERRNLSQANLAEKAGVTQSTVSRIVTGARIPSAMSCVLIAKALDLSPGLVLGMAGILPEDEEHTRYKSECDYKFSQLNERDQSIIIRMMDFLLSEGGEDNRVEEDQDKQGYQQKRLDISS
jgi:transcriptional regulator with XRE-family HTH domain